jgi:DNA invertase Pin-like site-specific DNA recombinase
MPPTSIATDGQFVRAAQYMRMSTEHQRYSLESQSVTNTAFALENGYEIVRSYTDAGISGLRFETRDGLKSLLADIVGGCADYAVVIVYDVSRWGRFQDPDEGAHYEFLCRNAGVPILYAAEGFSADDSLMSVIAKGLKRAMAAEYSRELSVKVARAQRALSAQGYWRGGPCGYGFRRCVVGLDGVMGRVLERYERNAIQGLRIRLVAGPPEEVATVQRIFKLFAVRGRSMQAIADLLNAQHAPSYGPWSDGRVSNILHDEKYVGVLVYNRRTFVLKRPTVHPREAWIRVENACPALVSRRLFNRAQKKLLRIKPTVSDEVLIEELKTLLATHGRLSFGIIAADDRAHCPAVYANRFGSLSAAYRLCGYEPCHKQRAAAARIHEHKPYLARPHRPTGTDKEMLEDLRRLYRAAGLLTSRLIQSSASVPSADAYRRRFGSLRRVYELVGYEPNAGQARALDANDRRPVRRS